MSIPFNFDAIPQFFRKKGFLEPRAKLAHLVDYFLIGLFISRCQSKPHSEYIGGKLYHLQPFEFLCGRESVSKETGISEDMIRTRLNTWQNQGILKKSPNTVPNKITFYIWSTEVFIEHSPQLETQQTPNRSPTEAPLTRTRSKDLHRTTATEESEKDSSSSFFYDCLKELNIEEIYKIDLSKEFPEIKVTQAVNYVLDERYVMKRSVEHTLFWFCRSKKKITHPEKLKPEWEILALKHNEIYAIHHQKGFLRNLELIKQQKMMIWQINAFVPISLGNSIEELKKDFEKAEKEYKIAAKNHRAKNKIEKLENFA